MSISIPWADGQSHEQYVAAWHEKTTQPLVGLDAQARRYVFYSRYNWERALRVREAYVMSDALKSALDALEAPQRWMVLTEDWCVDSAYSLPVFVAAAQYSPLVGVCIFPRDSHLELMDRYLTNGGRSIPKVVAFDADGDELFRWGPRPARIQARREAVLAEGGTKNDASEAVIASYENQGWKAVEEELVALLRG